jgi:hypothetical protein
VDSQSIAANAPNVLPEGTLSYNSLLRLFCCY